MLVCLPIKILQVENVALSGCAPAASQKRRTFFAKHYALAAHNVI
jgi:hypothetical protein